MDLQRPWPLMLNRDRDVETSKLDYSFWVSGLEGFWCGFTEALAFNVKPRPRCRNLKAKLPFWVSGLEGFWCGFTEALAFNVKPRPRCRNFQARLLFLGLGPRGLLVWIYRGLGL